MKFLRDLLGITKKASVEFDQSPDSFKTPMAINNTMLEKYGEAWLVFLPETIRESIKKDFSIEPSEILINKILATQLVVINPYLDWDKFENVINAFNNNIPDFTILEPPLLSELVWGYICIKSLRSDWEPSLEIKAYIESIMKYEGLLWCPWIPGVQGGYAPELIKRVKSAWKSPIKFTSNEMIGIQLDRLSIIKEYVRTWDQ